MILGVKFSLRLGRKTLSAIEDVDFRVVRSWKQFPYQWRLSSIFDVCDAGHGRGCLMEWRRDTAVLRLPYRFASWGTFLASRTAGMSSYTFCLYLSTCNGTAIAQLPFYH